MSHFNIIHARQHAMLLEHLSKNLFDYFNVMTELRRATAKIKGTSGEKGHSYRCIYDGTISYANYIETMI